MLLFILAHNQGDKVKLTLREYIDRRRLTQQEMGDIVRLTQQTINDWLKTEEYEVWFDGRTNRPYEIKRHRTETVWSAPAADTSTSKERASSSPSTQSKLAKA